LSDADFDVAVDVGPSSASKKQATVRALTGMMQITQDPETLQVLGAMAMMNMDGEGINEVRDYFRKRLIRMGVVKPTDEEIKALVEEQQAQANQPPDANTQFLQASADQASAEAVKARADTVLTINKARESEAKTMETLAGIDLAQRDQLLQAAETLGQPQKMG
jgi:hypothetical protein